MVLPEDPQHARWTVETLRALIDERDRRYEVLYTSMRESADERDKRYTQRFDGQQQALKDAREAQDKTVSAAWALIMGSTLALIGVASVIVSVVRH